MEITYHEYKAEDFEGFTGCLNAFYHGSHPYPQYFQKDFLSNLIEKGELLITLAKNSEGKVVGTSSAQKMVGTFENSLLLGMRYVDAEYQGMGIGKNQENFMFELIKTKFPGVRSIYADVVTNNPISQKTLIKNGFTFCGINMMFYREPSYKSMYEEEDFKLSMAIYAKANGFDAVTVYPPKKYQGAIEKIYNELGVPISIEKGSPTGKTEYIREELLKHGTAEFFVSKVGEDVEDLITDIKEELKKGNVISAYINMAKAGAEELSAILEPLGFYYCGIKPLNDSGEYLLMCNTKNHPGDLRNIIIPPESEEPADLIIGGAK